MAKTKPWVAGLIDNLAGSNLIRSTGIQHRNRLALVLLDSGLEIVEYIVQRLDWGIQDSR